MAAAREMLATLRLRAGNRRRIPIEEVWRAFRDSVRGYTGNVEARPRLATMLDELELAGELTRPKGRHLWERSIEPPMPCWVELCAVSRQGANRGDHRRIAWPPEMAFVTAIRSVRNLDELLAIRRFLATAGGSRPPVPVRERSVELFGDEKRLDALCKSALFGPGRLTLELLGCYEVAPPLTWEPAAAGAGRGVLILENLHTYDSFRRWNGRSGAYRAVAYGHGSEFLATVRDVPRLLGELDDHDALYFGDLDAKGLQIAAGANEWLRARGRALSPAARWYDLLLDRAEALCIPGEPATPPANHLDWLGPDLRDRAGALLAAGHRAPQELIGWELLAALA